MLYLLMLMVMCLYVSIVDFLHRKIQNNALLLLLLLQSFLSPLDLQITTFLLVLGIGLILYALIWIGAGDIKYAAVLSLTIPLNDLPWAYIMTAFAGGFLAVIYLITRKIISNKVNIQEGIPYGIAISVGFYLIILTQNTPHI
ncbi:MULTISPECIES: prepilin peptidase [Vibrio]|uniref:prepilin peptidase n=1 Tax=Vibrio TaxID=662 RepID=UPI002151B877|nr:MULTISPECIES: prepilin peptidase [Vibrio]MCE3220304.1 peptidase [Vibrio diabolicus]MDW1584322.1 prepilin peptidase [Vibrio sp. Vb2897]MDW1589096.1 prepilin peptidase [Vibrio sp. Vb2910]MDW1598410.1 prepilin peptidase [Vibrio sp. Vb2911]MDW1642616.1 prepilin peptidase [Vibrio sp. Vb2896]